MVTSAAATSPQATPSPAWTDPLLESPHTVQDKARRVNEMFSAIAPSYDLNNRLHSMWMDQHWRNVAVKMADVKPTDKIVDVACGTGDLTLKFLSKLCWKAYEENKVLAPNRVLGVDFTFEMLPIARKKAERAIDADEDEERDELRPIRNAISFVQGDAMALPLPDQSADILSIAFGIRNVSDWGKAIDEFARVLKPGGRLIILEFSLPTNPVMRAFYNFYFKKIMPVTATLISGDKSGAYKYLPKSVNTFISRQAMQDRMKSAGFSDVIARPMTFGICVCYKGVKR